MWPRRGLCWGSSSRTCARAWPASHALGSWVGMQSRLGVAAEGTELGQLWALLCMHVLGLVCPGLTQQGRGTGISAGRDVDAVRCFMSQGRIGTWAQAV